MKILLNMNRIFRVFPVQSNRYASSIGLRAMSAHAASAPSESLADVLRARHSSMDPQIVKDRLEQLKRNHMQYLSLDINWNTYKPEEKDEFLKTLDSLVNDGYHTWTEEQKKALPLTEIFEVNDQDIKRWDALLAKNEELQMGDWNKMSLDEKKAAYFLAWGPKEEPNTAFNQAVLVRTLLILGGTVAFYYALVKYFRSKKNLPTLTPEWKQATKERLIKERASPYTGVSSHVFTKEGIKEEESE